MAQRVFAESTTTHLAQASWESLVFAINQSQRGMITCRVTAPSRGRYAQGQFGANFTVELLATLTELVEKDPKNLAVMLRRALAKMGSGFSSPAPSQPTTPTAPSLPSF